MIAWGAIVDRALAGFNRCRVCYIGSALGGSMMQRAVRLAGVLFGVLSLAACGGREEGGSPNVSPSEPAQVQGNVPAGGSGDACGDPAQAREIAEDPSFELRATAAGPYAPSEEGRFEIVLTPRGNYHVNTQYPLSIHVDAPSGLTLPDAELEVGDAAEFGEPRARFQVPFTATSAGQHRVTASVDFAVCTPEACMPDCRTLALVLPVEAAAGTPSPTL
jgi:hypothetical protein